VEEVQHVAIAVVAPMLVVGGGGVALARRTLVPASEPGMRGPGEWLTEVIESRVVRALTHPGAVVLLYATVLYGVYASALYTLSLRSHAGHLILFAAALAAGGLYYWPLLGVLAPGRELPHATRLALLLSATLMQVVLGIALTRQTPVGTHAALWAGVCALLAVGTWVVYRADREPIDSELPAPAARERSAFPRAGNSTQGVPRQAG
jgi:putative copper resistance protein D